MKILLEVLIAICFVVCVFIACYYLCPPEKWTLQFTSKLVDVKPPTFGCSGLLIFENGKIIYEPPNVDIVDFVIGQEYEVWKNNYGNVKVVAK